MKFYSKDITNTIKIPKFNALLGESNQCEAVGSLVLYGTDEVAFTFNHITTILLREALRYCSNLHPKTSTLSHIQVRVRISAIFLQIGHTNV